tara:strand:+ start:521 stop:1222 length:702 start_codon:yes stop_codon:yes gene_type:complete
MSSDYLPDIEPPPEPTPEQLPEIPKEGIDDLVSEAGADEGAVTVEVNDDPDHEIVEDADDIPDEPVEPIVKEKKKLAQHDVFNTPQVLPVAPPKKAKRKATPKQLEALRKARENKKKNALARAEAIKEGKEVPEKLLTKKQQAKKNTKKTIQEEVKEHQQDFTDAQIAKITSQAIEAYEIKRKARKEVKNKKKAEEAHQAQIQATLQKAMAGGVQPRQQQRTWADDALAGMFS